MLALHLLSCLFCLHAYAGARVAETYGGLDGPQEPIYIEQLSGVIPPDVMVDERPAKKKRSGPRIAWANVEYGDEPQPRYRRGFRAERRAGGDPWEDPEGRRVMLSVGAGPSATLNQLDLSSWGGAKGRDGNPGLATSFQLIDRLSPDFGLGVEYDMARREERSSTSLIPSYDTTVGGRTSLLMGVVRLVLNPDSPVRLSILGGFGVHSTDLKIDAHPCPGRSWRDTHTAETRTLVDSSVIGYAGAVRAGLEIPLGDFFFIGGDVGYVFLHRTTYKVTAAGEHLWLPDITTGGKSLDAVVKLGFYL